MEICLPRASAAIDLLSRYVKPTLKNKYMKPDERTKQIESRFKTTC
jgi:hypothetical protein